ncbi:hypothetical protein [Marinobacter sp. MDS2]|uniref:hypothetical protein n=1 Tax=Marinobacter sp. MDS2 TaxID=3065961 RepID=UPI00273B6B91|nr:hypothetical protein [Marinobacter sp. MDS2]MDP4546515.1 hypothetical protein [Marinobacter sp. MDS2]
MNWVRLWHDMPNDPKWRAVARKSGQRIGDVMSVYLHMMVQASENEPRGSIEGWDDEDVAAALDIESDAVLAIREAMQGKVLLGNELAGWDKRQPKRHDDSRERVRRHREKKAGKSTECNESGNKESSSRNACNDDVTQCNAPDTDTDTDTNNPPSSADDTPAATVERDTPNYQGIVDLYNDLLGEFLPSVAVLNDKRRRTIKARWKQKWGERSYGNDLNFWRKYFVHVRQSKPLTGTKDGFDWRPGFDWLLNETNMTKVIEGNYHQGDDRRTDHLKEAV